MHSNENSVEIKRYLSSAAIRSDKYFESLVSAAASEGLLLREETADITSQLFSLLCDICFSIAQNGTSSIKTETAQDISDSIAYCIGIRLKSENDADKALKFLKSEKIEKLYYDGLIKNDEMLKKARMRYTVLKKNLFKTENTYYNETINDGLKAFFSSYDQKTSAHKSVILFDYPLYCDIEPLCGAEFVCRRIENILFENEFCLNFNPETVHLLMMSLRSDEGLEGDYRELPVNIYSYVLFQALGLEMCQKDIFELNLDDYEIGMLEKTFRKKSCEEIRNLLVPAQDALLKKLTLSPGACDYVSKSVSKLAFELSSLGARNVPHLFLNRNKPHFEQKKAKPSDLLSDEVFASLLIKLKNTLDEKERAVLICENVKSDRDFDDLVTLANFDAEQTELCIKKAPQRLFLRLMHKYRVRKSNDNETTAEAVKLVFDSMSKENAKKLDDILFSM